MTLTTGELSIVTSFTLVPLAVSEELKQTDRIALYTLDLKQNLTSTGCAIVYMKWQSTM